MTSCAAFGKRLPNCSCFCSDSAQRGKASLQLACGFIDHRVPSQLSPSRPRPLNLGGGVGAGNTCSLLSKHRLGHLTASPFHQGRCRCFSIFQRTIPPRPRRIPVSVAEGLGRRAIRPHTHQIPGSLPALGSIRRTARTHLPPKFGAWGSRGTWRVAMAQPGGPEQPREPAAGDGFTDVIRSRAGRTLLLLLFWEGGGGVLCGGIESGPAPLRRGCALEVSAGFRKVVVAQS